MTPNLAISLLRWWVGEKEIFRSAGSGSDWTRGELVHTGWEMTIPGSLLTSSEVSP